MKSSTWALAAALLLHGTVAWAAPQGSQPGATSDPTPWQSACRASDVGLTGVAGCSGYFEGNLLNNGQPAVPAITEAVGGLGLDDYTHWLDKFGSGSLADAAFYGDTVIGVHFGRNHWDTDRPQGGATAFFRFDAGMTGLTGLDFASDDPATIAVYRTGAAPLLQAAGPLAQGDVPEPGTAMLLLVGLGLAAVSARLR